MTEEKLNWVETHRSLILPRDLDHLGHLNIARYYEAITSAGMDLMGKVGLPGKEVARRRIGLVVLRLETDFMKEVHAGETIVIRSTFSKLGGKSLEARHQIYVADDEENPVASCLVVGPMMDLNARKAVTIPDDLREKMAALFHPEEKQRAGS